MKASRGFVLMAALLLLGLVSMAVLLSSLSSTEAATQQALRTQLALKEAKEAVLGYILLDAAGGSTQKPGSIPCPDRDNDNDSDLFDNPGNNCGGFYINRLPGKNFRTGELRDSGNEKLWYAISPGFRSGSPDAVNSLTPTTLSVDGQGEYVAVILAPGAPLPGQTRTDSASRANYLESSNASGTFQFVTTKALEEGETAEQAKTKFNDRLIGITKKEWEDAIVRRVASDVIGRIKAKIVAGVLPAAMPPSAYSTSPDGNSPQPWNGDPTFTRGLLPASQLWAASDWARKNEWYKVVYYVIAPAFAAGGTQDCSSDSSQCLTLRNGSNETKNIKALIVFAGSAYDGQTRSESFSVADYLEGEENTNNDNVFELPAPGSTSNDRFYIIK